VEIRLVSSSILFVQLSINLEKVMPDEIMETVILRALHGSAAEQRTRRLIVGGCVRTKGGME
jgi:hypothetical protein